MSRLLDRWAGRGARWLVHQPRQVILALTLIVVGSLALLPSLRPAAGLSAFVADDDPSLLFLDEVERAFVSDEVVFVAYETENPFSKASLEEIRALGARLAQLSEVDATGAKGPLSLVDEVVSLATISDVSGADMTYRSVPLVPEVIPSAPAELEAIRARAHRNQLIRDGLLSEDSPRAAALLVRLRPGLEDRQQTLVVKQVRDELEALQSSTKFMVTGAPVAEADTIEYMLRDLKKFIPITYVLLLLVMYVFTRRIAGVVLALVNASVAVIFGMAMLAMFGSITNLSTIMPPLLMVLSVATVVHFLTEYARNTHTVGAERAAETTLHELMVPAFMCEFTTAVGLGSFAVSRIPAMREFGLAAALAVMGAFASSFLVIAVAVRWLGAERLISSQGISASARVEALLSRYTELAIRRPKSMLVVMGFVSVFAAVGLGWFKVDHDNLSQFGPEVPLHQATDFVNQHFGGSSEYIVSIRTTNENRFLEPAEMQKLEKLQAFLTSEGKATTSTSVADYLKMMNRGFNDDNEAALRIPDTREQVAQLVLLNGDDRLFQFVDRSWSWVRLSARTTESGSAVVSKRLEVIEKYLGEHFPASAGYQARITGSTSMGVVMAKSILDGQISSFLLSMVLIFVPIVLVFGSVVAGLYTIPSNLFPILACMGLMGWVGIPLDIATSMTTAVILGIAVDDTIHFVQSMRSCLAAGDDLEKALRHTMATKGVGALWITLIVTLGFGALVASNFRPTSSFGVLTAFGMIAGVMAEVFLLPPLMIVTRTRLGVPLPPPAHVKAPKTTVKEPPHVEV